MRMEAVKSHATHLTDRILRSVSDTRHFTVHCTSMLIRAQDSFGLIPLMHHLLLLPALNKRPLTDSRQLSLSQTII